MDRKHEIEELLKSLLGKIIIKIDGNQHSSYFHQVLKSANSVVEISKQIELYLNELNQLK